MDDREIGSSGTDEEGTMGRSADGVIRVRNALAGLGFIWLTAVAAFGALGAAVYGVTTSIGYLLVAVLAAAVAVYAGAASLRTFGYR